MLKLRAVLIKNPVKRVSKSIRPIINYCCSTGVCWSTIVVKRAKRCCVA